MKKKPVSEKKRTLLAKTAGASVSTAELNTLPTSRRGIVRRYMRSFYQAFQNFDALRPELSWMYDDLRRGPEDNPTVGVILCACKDETVVRYSVLSEHKRLFASRYKLVLPSEIELRAELMREQKLLADAQEAQP